MALAEEGVTYPRDVPVEEGMPKGWKGIEKLYGPSSKSAGRMYLRYFSLDGKHRNICTAKQVITIDCENKGLDPAPVIERYYQLQKERQHREAEQRRTEREAKGKLAGEARENAVNRFREAFGQLAGPIVFNFKGWTTRWHYQPNCDQVMVEYIDTDGQSWKLLKDLECAFQIRIDNGEGDHIRKLIKDAKVQADPNVFAEGAKSARETKGVYERTPQSEGGRVFSQEDRVELRKQRQDERGPQKRQRTTRLHLGPDGPKQTGWAALASEDDVKEALKQFRGLLRESGFSSSVELLLVRGASAERRFAKRLGGVYVQLPETISGQRCYQKLMHYPQTCNKIGCDGIYVAWSSTRFRWEIATDLREGRAIIAHSAESSTAPPAAAAEGPWRVQDGSGEFTEDAGLAVTTPAPP